jgi:23S rRNA pseudouridine2605 synthase
MAEQRLQKFLASAGLASRRKAEELITAGRVKVNEKRVTTLGTKVDPDRDLVTVDGALVSQPEAHSYYLLYKPSGCVTTASDPEGRPTAIAYLRGVPGRVFPIGRLDYDAEGALLFTDDGELANRLAHPRYGHRRVYLVKVKGDPPAEALERMKAGVRLEDGPAQALEVAVHEHAEKNVWIRVVVAEGRYHLVKRLCESVGLQVQRLFRPEFGGISVERLRPGQFRALSSEEVHALHQRVGLASGTAAPGPSTSMLPKAARRHGHGPPAPPSAERGERVEERERGRMERAVADAERDTRGGRGARDDRGGPGARGERSARGERDARRERDTRGERPARGSAPDGRGREGRGSDRRGGDDRPAGAGRVGRSAGAARRGAKPRETKPPARRAGGRPGATGAGASTREGGAKRGRGRPSR